MASSSRTISQTVWEAQKEMILHLRFTEGLPLSNKNNKTSGRTVIQVMREDHQFEATQSQYEQQLKRWGAAKNVKRSDWESILPIYYRLKQQGLSPRIRLGETVLDERRVKKAQRRYFGQSEMVPMASITPTMSSAQNSLLQLDVRQHSGEYVEYSEFIATSNTEEISSMGALVQPATAYTNHQDQAIPEGQTLAPGSHFNLAILVPEFDMLSGEHLEYSEFDEVVNAEATSSLTGPVQLTSINPNAQCQVLQDDPTLTSGSPFRFATLGPGFDVFRPNIPPLEIELGDEGRSFSPVAQQPWSANDPGSLLETFVLASPTRSVTHVNERTRSPDLTTPRRLLFKPCINSMLDRIIPDIDSVLDRIILHDDSVLDRIISDTGQTGNEIRNILTRMIAISLEYLLVEHSSHASGPISDLTSLRYHGVSQLPRIITSCFVNNLAGLDEFPLCVLFWLIKAYGNVRESVLTGLRSNNVAFATALADCALRSAILVGDEDIAAIILETTKGNINKIDLNSTVYHFKGKQCSPLGLAAEICHLGLVRKLLNFGAKVDVGALNAAIKSWRYFKHAYGTKTENAMHQIIEIFLENGASVDCKTLKRVLQYGVANDSALELLIRAVFRESHWKFLKLRDRDERYFATLTKENAWAQTLFLDLLETCQSMGCSDTCKSTHIGAFDRILISAITNGNFELASSLLDHVQPTVGSLIAAIQTGNFEILQAFLSKRIDINDCARCFENLAFHYYGCNCATCFEDSASDYSDDCDCAPLIDDVGGWCRLATPLSEAILLRNQDLISMLEEHGALDRVRDGTHGHLTAALVAAVRVGDVPLLKSLLRLGGTCEYCDDFQPAIAEAIFAGHVEMVKILSISLTSKFYSVRPGYHHIDKLLLAMKRRSYEIVFFLLEYQHYVGSRDRVVLEAVRWGDNEIIEHLHDWEFFTPDTLRPFKLGHREEPVSALYEAMAARNAELVNRMLDWGADPSEHIPFAVAVGDENMVRFLLDQGGKPSGVEEAISNGQYSILELLLGHRVAPVGLELTITSGEHDMMRLLLRHGADPADDDAFSAALLCDDATFLGTLSNAFSSQYPTGKKGFGLRALKTALLYCCTSVFKQLLILNLDVNSYNDGGPFKDWSPNILHIAIQQPTDGHAYLSYLHKCNPGGCKYSSARRTDSEWEDIITLLLVAGASPENVSQNSTALLCAIKTGRIQTVKLLLDRGINVNRPAGRGVRRTPLQQACEEGDFEIVKLLLDKGTDVNALPARNSGATALQLAAIKGSQRIVRLLLDEGADIHGPKAIVNGRTTLEGAAEHGRLSIINTLFTEGAPGFSADDIESAKALAEDQGHQGCVKRLELELFRLRKDNEALLPLRL